MVAASPTMHWKRSSNQNIEDFIEKIRAIKNEPFRMLLGSAHQMGTARINPDPNQGVIDLNGKVHGLDNIRVIDSSIMPDIVSGNLNAATIMIAEKVADIILGKEEEPIKADFCK